MEMTQAVHICARYVLPVQKLQRTVPMISFARIEKISRTYCLFLNRRQVKLTDPAQYAIGSFPPGWICTTTRNHININVKVAFIDGTGFDDLPMNGWKEESYQWITFAKSSLQDLNPLIRMVYHCIMIGTYIVAKRYKIQSCWMNLGCMAVGESSGVTCA